MASHRLHRIASVARETNCSVAIRKLQYISMIGCYKGLSQIDRHLAGPMKSDHTEVTPPVADRTVNSHHGPRVHPWPAGRQAFNIISCSPDFDLICVCEDVLNRTRSYQES